MAQLNRTSKQYKDLFFDLDHTLWDYDTNAKETLTELYFHHQFNELNLFTVESFIFKFFEINNQLWYAFNNGRVDKEEIRTTRFPIVLKALGLDKEQVPNEIGDQFIMTCPTKSNLIQDSLLLLNYLKPSYRLHIITNGFSDIQKIKLSHAKLDDYFDIIVTSESIGYRKPQREIFDYALESSKADRYSSIMIGDNLKTDIMGAQNADLDQVYFNPEGTSHAYNITHEVRSLKELLYLF